MAQASTNRPGGPAVRAVDPWLPGDLSRESFVNCSATTNVCNLRPSSASRKRERIYSKDEPADAIFNKDIAEYVGLSSTAVSRGFRDMAERRVIRIRDRRDVNILDRKAFEELASETNRQPARPRSTKQ